MTEEDDAEGYTATVAEVAQAAEQAKAEIREDMASGRVPTTVTDFSELHDHVDANGYGGLFDTRASWSTDSLIKVQDIVHEWLAAGRPETCEHCGATIEEFRKHWWTGDDFMCPDGETPHRPALPAEITTP